MFQNSEKMIKFIIFSTFFCLLTYAGQIVQIGKETLQPYTANEGERTFYQFTFGLPTAIESNAFIEVHFPADYNVNSFSEVSCGLAPLISSF